MEASTGPRTSDPNSTIVTTSPTAANRVMAVRRRRSGSTPRTATGTQKGSAKAMAR